MRNILLILMSSMLVIGCGESQPEEVQESATSKSGVFVSIDSFGAKWPFTVESGVLDCVKGSAAIFKVNDISYQLNGVASNLGYKSIDSIWKDNVAIPGTKVSLGPMLSLALEQC